MMNGGRIYVCSRAPCSELPGIVIGIAGGVDRRDIKMLASNLVPLIPVSSGLTAYCKTHKNYYIKGLRGNGFCCDCLEEFRIDNKIDFDEKVFCVVENEKIPDLLAQQ